MNEGTCSSEKSAPERTAIVFPRVDFSRTCLFAHVVILKEPITLGVQVAKDLDSGNDLLLRGQSLLRVFHQFGFEVCLVALLLSDGLRITAASGGFAAPSLMSFSYSSCEFFSSTSISVIYF